MLLEDKPQMGPKKVPERLRDSKVPEFEKLIGGDENVLGLEISVDDVLLVQVLKREADLDEPVADLRLRKKGKATKLVAEASSQRDLTRVQHH